MHAYDLQPFTRLNLNGTVDCKLARGAICDSLENVKIQPVGCKSFYDAYPRTQHKILPYLVPAGTRERVGFLNPTGIATFDQTSDTGRVDYPQYLWDPLTNHNFVVGVYRPPSGNFNTFVELLDSTIDQIHKVKSAKVRVIGDFNVNLYNTSSNNTNSYWFMWRC